MFVGRIILKKLLRINAAVLIFISIIFLLVCNIIYSFSFSTDSFFSKERAADFLRSQELSVKNASASKNKKLDFLQQNKKDLYVNSKDNLRLHALYKENTEKSDTTVIVCHGYFGSSNSAKQYAQGFFKLGFNVLCPDSRAHGESEGNIITMGYLEKDEIILWANELLKQKPNLNIILFGVSMGGATVLMAGGEESLPPNVKAIISDCSYSSAYDEVDYIIKNITALKSSALTKGISFISLLRSGFSLKAVSPLESVKKCKVHILFIHGSNDNFVPFSMLDELYESASCKKQKLVITDASHGGSINKDSKLYWDTISKFIDENLERS